MKDVVFATLDNCASCKHLHSGNHGLKFCGHQLQIDYRFRNGMNPHQSYCNLHEKPENKKPPTT